MIPWDDDMDVCILLSEDPTAPLNTFNYIERIHAYNALYPDSGFAIEKCYLPGGKGNLCTTVGRYAYFACGCSFVVVAAASEAGRCTTNAFAFGATRAG